MDVPQNCATSKSSKISTVDDDRTLLKAMRSGSLQFFIEILGENPKVPRQPRVRALECLEEMRCKHLASRCQRSRLCTRICQDYISSHVQRYYIITLWLFNIAMENGPFIDGLPIKNGDFPWLY